MEPTITKNKKKSQFQAGGSNQPSGKNSRGDEKPKRAAQSDTVAEATRSTQTQTTAPDFVDFDKFLKVYFPDLDEEIHVRAFYAKEDPRSKTQDSLRYHWITRRELREDESIRRILTEWNSERGIYVGVNSAGDLLDGTPPPTDYVDETITGGVYKRTNKNTGETKKATYASGDFNGCFVENDNKSIEEQNAELDACPLSTTMRIQTKRSVWGHYALKGENPGDESETGWRGIQEGLIHRIGGDEANKNPSRVVRAPGFDHISVAKEIDADGNVVFETAVGKDGNPKLDKDGNPILKPKLKFDWRGKPVLERQRVKIVDYHPERKYTLDELREAFPSPAEENGTKRGAQPRANAKAAGASTSKPLPLTPEDLHAIVNFNKSDPVERWYAEAGAKATAIKEASWNSRGNIDFPCPYHDGQGNTSAFYTTHVSDEGHSANRIRCNAGCEENDIMQALDMPPKPAGKHRAQQGFNKYSTTPSGLVWHKSENEKVPLCNFVAEITGEVIRDDGTEQTDVYEITATLNGVTKVGTVTAADFPSLKWVNKLLGARAIVCPNREKYVGEAIRRLSENIKTRTVVAHTGWRNDGDGWKYYHAGGAISEAGLVDAEVSLPVQLENLSLVTPPDGAQLSEDVRAVFDDLLNVTPNKPDVMVAGIGEVLCSVFSKPDFSGFDFGTTGTRKSQIQALKQSFFGCKYNDENLPESWRSSEYALETFASKIKDAAGCIDEFKPEGAGTAREKWHTKADYVLRGAANKQGRTTLRQDRSERAARIPQGMLFCSGEELPIGESLRARLSIKEYDDKTVDLARLTTAQRQAADGVYARVMSAFIQWLATDNRIETLREQRDEEIQRRRQEWLSAGVNSHGRTANNNAHLEWAWDTFFAFVVEKNLIDADSLQEYRALIASALDQHGRNQAKYLVTANDALKFVEFIQNAILSGKAHLTDQKGEMPDDPVKWGWKKGTGIVQAQGTCIGYVNGDEVYLLPDESYRIASDGGTGTDKIRATKDALQKRLREEGLLAYTTETGNPKNNKNTVQKRFRGARVWMLAFKAATFIGDGADGDSEPDADVPFNKEPEESLNVVYGKFSRVSLG